MPEILNVLISYLKNIRRFFRKRATLILLGFLLQLTLYLYLFSFFRDNRVIYFISLFVSLIIILYIFNVNDHPSYKMFWIFVILFLPIGGIIFYLIFGGKKIPKNLRNEFRKHRLEKICEKKISGDINTDGLSSFEFLKNISNYNYYKGNDITYYGGGSDFYLALIEELKQAKDFILMEYFIVSKGVMFETILEILRKKVKENVKVFFLYDDAGSIDTFDRKLRRQLKEDGIALAAFNPVKVLLSLKFNNRDHRKITVIDNRVAFMGGLNIGDEYIHLKKVYGHWKDSGVRIKGQVCRNCTKMFIQMFNASSEITLNDQDFLVNQAPIVNNNLALAFSDSPSDQNLIARSLHLRLIQKAEKYIYIHTPYLILDYDFTNSLINAARSGCEVIITCPGIADKKIVNMVTKYNYRELIKNNIKIYEYTEGFLHSKMFIVDDILAINGTINMDYRSYYLHYECGILFNNPDTIKMMKKDYLNTLEVCRQYTYEDYQKIGLFKKLVTVIASLFSPMF